MGELLDIVPFKMRVELAAEFPAPGPSQLSQPSRSPLSTYTNAF